MKVGIDISQMAFPGTGVAVYTKNLVENLLKMGGNYSLLGTSLRRQNEFKVFPQTKVYPIPPTILEILWNQMHIFPVENLIGNVDVFHSSDWTQPPSKAKRVTTIHDLVVYKYPQSTHPKIVAAQKRRLEWVKKECDLIIAVSQATKKDIVEILKIPEEKIRVVYEACDIKPTNSAKYKFDKPYILAVGTRQPRKNLNRLVQAWKLLKNKEVDLVVAGNYGWGDDIAGVKALGYVSQEDLYGLYTNAAVFVYPSLYEGFGIPILEAFSCGCSVVTSNISSMPEVGGKAAIYVDPENIEDIKNKIEKILEMNPSEKKKLIEVGFQQAGKFSWEKAAAQTRKVYEELT